MSLFDIPNHVLEGKKKDMMQYLSIVDEKAFCRTFSLLTLIGDPNVVLKLAKAAVKVERLDLIKYICIAYLPNFILSDGKLTLTAAKSGCLLSLAKLYDYDVPIHPDAMYYAEIRGHQRCLNYIRGAFRIYPQRENTDN